MSDTFDFQLSDEEKTRILAERRVAQGGAKPVPPQADIPRSDADVFGAIPPATPPGPYSEDPADLAATLGLDATPTPLQVLAAQEPDPLRTPPTVRELDPVTVSTGAPDPEPGEPQDATAPAADPDAWQHRTVLFRETIPLEYRDADEAAILALSMTSTPGLAAAVQLSIFSSFLARHLSANSFVLLASMMMEGHDGMDIMTEAVHTIVAETRKAAEVKTAEAEAAKNAAGTVPPA